MTWVYSVLIFLPIIIISIIISIIIFRIMDRIMEFISKLIEPNDDMDRFVLVECIIFILFIMSPFIIFAIHLALFN